jgi:methylated-DNA-protein-cysteine methyltransferase related protein
VVRGVPRGRVATYGQIAAVLGVPRGARAVGWALRALRGQAATRVPWHRVVGAGGRISLRNGAGPLVQRKRLEGEGVRFDAGRIDLAKYGIRPG